MATGTRMVAAHPLTGVGPRQVHVQAESYRDSEIFPEWHYQHLHNNVLQIAAEAGLLALVAWVLLWVRVALDLLRFRRGQDPSLRLWASVGLAVLAAFLVAGMLEYNFGDSEVLILLFFFVTVPYILARRMGEPGRLGS